MVDKKNNIISEYFPKPTYFAEKVKVEVDLPNCATTTDLKNTTGADTLDFPKKTNLANLKPDVDKLDIHKLKNVPSNLCNLKSKIEKLDIGKLETTASDLSKLSNVIILRSEILKIKYLILMWLLILLLRLKNELKNSIPTTINLVTNASLNDKINEVKNKIHNITNLASTTTVVENKIPDHSKYITAQEFDKLTAENFTARLKKENLAAKDDIGHFVKKDVFR